MRSFSYQGSRAGFIAVPSHSGMPMVSFHRARLGSTDRW